MNVYRLNPIDPGHPSWRFSIEKDPVWTCAPTPKDARALVAVKTGLGADAAAGTSSPWLDETATTCVLEPTMTYPDPGEVIREDGSLVNP
jgi:hypothetical protein